MNESRLLRVVEHSLLIFSEATSQTLRELPRKQIANHSRLKLHFQFT